MFNKSTYWLTIIISMLLFSQISAKRDEISTKKNSKRGTTGYEWDNFAPAPWNSLDNTLALPTTPLEYLPHHAVSVPIIAGYTIQKHIGIATPISPIEVESAIRAAKDASAQVITAQQRVMAAKDAVLTQQRIASIREAAAQAAQQRSEAAAQAQRAEASAAATAVVLAQQRLAEAKAQVAANQRIAAAKEAHAAHVIQKSANAAALRIQRIDAEAAKLAALQKSESAVIQHVNPAKEASLAATSAVIGAHPISPIALAAPDSYHPWG